LGRIAIRPNKIRDPNYAVNVVGHDDEFVIKYLYIGAHLGGAEPFFSGDVAEAVETHVALDQIEY